MRQQLEQLFLAAFAQTNYTQKTPNVHIVWLTRVVGTIELVHRFPEIRIREDRLDLSQDVEGLSAAEIRDPKRLNERILGAAFDLLQGVVKPSSSAMGVLSGRSRILKSSTRC